MRLGWGWDISTRHWFNNLLGWDDFCGFHIHIVFSEVTMVGDDGFKAFLDVFSCGVDN